MKLYIPCAYDENLTNGKALFCNRLAKVFLDRGIKIVKTPQEKHDVSLNLARMVKTNSKKRVIRLDGVYHDKLKNYKKGNVPLKKALRASDAVIYQSKFSKKICDTFLGKYKGLVTVIPNGASIEYYKDIKPMALGKYNHIFLAASRWRPHKRLKDIIESYLMTVIPQSCLFIAGNIKNSGLSKSQIKKYSLLENIKFLGVLSQVELSRYLVASTAFIHLCWFDNCPNSVVESICAGTPVICNNIGGTIEMVTNSGGYVCKIDKPYNFKPCDLYHPPKIKRSLIADALTKSVNENISVNKESVDIKNIAHKYLEFFEKILR